LADFLLRIDVADKNHIVFANFVDFAENFLEKLKVMPDTVFSKNSNEYQKIWFDLKTINALALNEWEEDFQSEAKMVLIELKNIF
jgi:hypothetical protein